MQATAASVGSLDLTTRHRALLLSTFLTLWFDPSMAESTYESSYAPMRGVELSQSMASTLAISFDVRGGLLMRQMHHWAVNL